MVAEKLITGWSLSLWITLVSPEERRYKRGELTEEDCDGGIGTDSGA